MTSRAGYPSARISQETACADPFGRPVELWCIPTMEMGYDKITSLSGIETMGNMFFSQPVCFFFFYATYFQRKPSVVLLAMDHQLLGRWVVVVLAGLVNVYSLRTGIDGPFIEIDALPMKFTW